MAYKLFLSHSVAAFELGTIYALAEEVAKHGIDVFVPDRTWELEKEVPERIKKPLNEADFTLAIATRFGTDLNYLNYEISLIKDRNKLLVIMDQGLKVTSNIPNKMLIRRDNPAQTLAKAADYIAKLKREKELKNVLTWLGVGALLFMLLTEKEK